MRKRFLTLLLVVCLCFSFSSVAFAIQEHNFIIDEKDFLLAEEVDALNIVAGEIYEASGACAMFAYLDDSKTDVSEYCEKLFKSNSPSDNGIAFAVSGDQYYTYYAGSMKIADNNDNTQMLKNSFINEEGHFDAVLNYLLEVSGIFDDNGLVDETYTYGNKNDETVTDANLNVNDLKRVVDDADLLTDEEKDTLTEKISNVQKSRQFDIVIVTKNTLEGKSPQEYADDYYNDNGYGIGNDRDGCLLLLDMENLDWYISTCGFGITALTEEIIDYISGETVPYLFGADYYTGFDKFVTLCNNAVAQKKLNTEDGADISLSKKMRIVDDADLLTEQEEENLTKKIEKIILSQNFDIVIVTKDTLNGKNYVEYADDYYDYNGYGIGDSRDGCLLLLDMENRDWYISTCGFGITALTDAMIDFIGEAMTDYLSDGDYYNGFNEFVTLCDDAITQAKNGKPYDIGSLPKKTEWGIWIAISAVIALLGAFIGVSVMKSKMKTVLGKNQANDYIREGSMNVTGRRDIYLYSNVSKTERSAESGSSGGSSIHTSSSGSSHGGGGGKF